MDTTPSSSSFVHYPVVDENTTPKLGMHFDDLDEAYNFYNAYGKLAGFSIRKESSNRGKDGEVVWKRFVCSGQGKTDEKHWIDKEFVQRRRMQTRFDCKAQLQVKIDKSGGYVVSKFVPQHSHAPTTPSKRLMLRSRRQVPESKRQIINTYDSANVRSKQQMQVLASQSGGLDKIGFTDTNAKNHRRDEKEKKRGLDGQLLFQLFENRKEMGSGFTYTIERDADKKITHVFWANGAFRSAYKVFGDVVTFDTTYKTNCCGLTFAAFVGCNHHGQTTLFGCGFLPNEKTESFEWLFRKWLEAMSFSPPKRIITDQDLAITKAIKNVMPNTVHRYCLWHILDKLPSNLGGVHIHNDGLIDMIKKCVHNSQTSSHFESYWNQIITDNKLMENEWLADIYKIRHMWVPAYIKENFFGGMSTTHRSESMNAFVKQYVEYTNSLLDFILRFDTGVERLRYLEKKEDFENSNGRPEMKTCSPLEKQMANIYTKNLFYKFQDELFMIMSLGVKLVTEDDVSCNFVVKNFLDEQEIEREILWKKDEMHAYCSCKKFEFEGIPCRHLLSVLRHLSIPYVPERYILKQWTKGVTKEILVDDVEIGSATVNSCLARHSHLSCMFAGLIDIASQSREGFEFLVSSYTELEMKLRQVTLNNPTDISIDNGEGLVDSNVVEYHEPSHAVTKGCAKRLKSSKENATKGRLCRGCNKRGVSHDKRNCPVLLNK
ncbi:protein FAR1-RELATED SEQUENCE 5-like protein [Cinnamomum micranthum f. kanehirae]|uniref:Protein FAR1-RELATED SEQUENCE 5-like protein n=1 Tax=Cinnamomum micranthum f. kanehirae TaxID=337451 RepID=A0A3S3MVB1_9MAGN|nr:protein FAR1-RELATED SEQUENCE 5-like protein [Cinnamomum micranthum f. kanehirae]